MSLSPAQIAAAKCNFVTKTTSLAQCKKYNIDCCSNEEEMKTAFLLYKEAQLTSEGCTISDGAVCSIQNLTPVTNACTKPPTCADLFSCSIKKFLSGGAYTKAIENSLDATAYMSIELTPNSVAQPAKARAIVYDSSGVVMDEEFTTGKYFDGLIVNTGDEYHPHVGIQFGMGPWLGTADSYIKSIRLYHYNSGVIGFTDLDISPTNIWACPSCTAVDPADLYFDAPNVHLAVQTQIENAIKSIDGVLNADIEVDKSTTSLGTHLFIRTKTKHLPSFKWWGLSTSDVNIQYFWAPENTVKSIGVGSNLFANIVYSGTGWAYENYSFVTPCATSILTVNGNALPQATNASTFYSISLSSPITTTVVTNPPLVLSGSIPDCYAYNLEALVNSSVPHTQQWLSPSNVVLGTAQTLSLTNPVHGTYKYIAAFSGSDCTITKNITL